MVPDVTMPQVAAQTTQISMSPDSSKAFKYAHGLGWQPRPRTSAWPLVVTWTIHLTQTLVGYNGTVNPHTAFSDSLGQDAIMNSDGSKGHSDQIGPSISTAPRHQQGLRQQPRP